MFIGGTQKRTRNLFGELDGLDLNESSGHGLHIGLGIAEGDTATSNGVPGTFIENTPKIGDLNILRRHPRIN